MGGIQDGTVSELARMRGSDNGPSDNWRMGRYERRLLNLGIRDCMRTKGKRRRGGPRVWGRGFTRWVEGGSMGWAWSIVRAQRIWGAWGRNRRRSRDNGLGCAQGWGPKERGGKIQKKCDRGIGLRMERWGGKILVRKMNFMEKDITKNIKLISNVIKTFISLVRWTISKKKTWCGSKIEFMMIKRPKVRQTLTSKSF